MMRLFWDIGITEQWTSENKNRKNGGGGGPSDQRTDESEFTEPYCMARVQKVYQC